MGKENLDKKQRDTAIVSLYLQNEPVESIATRLGVSSATIYRVLRKNSIEKKSVESTAMKALISFDEETAAIIEREKPKGLSRWVCSMIKRGCNIIRSV